MRLRLGAHLPLASLAGPAATVDELCRYASTAHRLGFSTLAANDHLVWRRPWLDGPTALAAVLAAAGDLTLATTVSLPVVRHPAVLAKTLSTLALLATGPVVAGLGPGSSRADYAAVGRDFDTRWAQFDEALQVVRALVRGEPVPPGRFYAEADLRLDPLPATPPQVWFGSWGSDARLRAMAAHADGWLASGYNTTPSRYADARARLDGHLHAVGRDPAGFPDAIATMWLHLTDRPEEARSTLADVLAPVLSRDPDELARILPVGNARALRRPAQPLRGGGSPRGAAVAGRRPGRSARAGGGAGDAVPRPPRVALRRHPAPANRSPPSRPARRGRRRGVAQLPSCRQLSMPRMSSADSAPPAKSPPSMTLLNRADLPALSAITFSSIVS